MADILSKIPTEQLIAELATRDEVEVMSEHFCREASYTITFRVRLPADKCPVYLRCSAPRRIKE